MRGARVSLHLRSKPAAAQVEGDRISSVTAVDLEHGGVRFCPGVVLDATELGDLLPLVGAEYASAATRASKSFSEGSLRRNNPTELLTGLLDIRIEFQCPAEILIGADAVA